MPSSHWPEATSAGSGRLAAQSRRSAVMGLGLLRRGHGGDAQSLDKIVDRMAERCQLRVISFRDVDHQPLCESGDQIKKIHRVDIELVAQFGVRIESARIRLWRDPAEFVDQHGGYIVAGHSVSGPCSL